MLCGQYHTQLDLEMHGMLPKNALINGDDLDDGILF